MYWIHFDQRLHENKFFELIGKAVFVCQHFEHGCKDMVMWFSLAKALCEEQIEYLSQDHLDFVDKLLELSLGNSLNELNKISKKFYVNEDEFLLLKSAKESRNYICHESELSLIYAPFGSSFTWSLNESELKKHTENIAIGDYLVSKWSYEFHEKIPSSFIDKDKYVNSLLNWIF